MSADIATLYSIKEIALAAFGALAVAQCHLQLAKQRVESAGDRSRSFTADDLRITNDHLDTVLVFTDSATAVLASINEMISRAERKEAERELKIRTA